mmetsp:Transcript_7577/g.6925  ORF Transcript_7577/g.6925 Transcript_7577/m.6925 type:complete len:84 (-) Transcript_7577:487-738(-)
MENFDLNWFVDFDREVISGSITLSMKTIAATSQVILDTESLIIHSVFDANGNELDHSLVTVNPNLGEALVIELGETIAAGNDV